MAYLLVILALILLVVVHELGHFLAARAVGVRATKFYVFFPPALFKRQVGDVEYGIGAIPAGGFVKLPGMFEPVPGEVAERLGWDIDRLLTECADADIDLDDDDGPAAMLRAATESIGEARDADVLIPRLERVDAALVAFGGGPEIAAVPAGRQKRLVKRVRQIRGRVGGLIDDCHPRAYWRASLWRRMTVIAAGPAVNVVVAFVVLAGFWWLYMPTQFMGGPLVVEKVVQDSPAREAGLSKGSKVTWWNGPVEGATVKEFSDRFEAQRGKPVDVRWVTADGERLSERIVPATIDGEQRIGINGFSASEAARVEHDRTSIGFGARTALAEMRAITWGNVTRLPQVFFDKEVRDEVSSVVGIVQVAEDVDLAGHFWHYVGIISLVLAVMNLLPLLPLDGGHLFFGLLEFIRRGRPMPRASFERFSAVGISLVLMLFFIGLGNDLG